MESPGASVTLLVNVSAAEPSSWLPTSARALERRGPLGPGSVSAGGTILGVQDGLLASTGTFDTRGLVYHYTKAATAFDFIIPTMTFQLSSIVDTNDPWEGRYQACGFTRTKRTDRGVGLEELDELVKRTRVGCFCRDEESASKQDRMFTGSCFGWARDRMWAQYADHHRGLCLWFDREKLIANAREALGARGDIIAGDVSYERDDVPRSDTVDLDLLSALGVRAYAVRLAPGRFFSVDGSADPSRFDGRGREAARRASAAA